VECLNIFTDTLEQSLLIHVVLRLLLATTHRTHRIHHCLRLIDVHQLLSSDCPLLKGAIEPVLKLY